MTARKGYAGTLKERFDRKWVADGDCWRWVGSMDTKGYGQMRIDRKAKLATHVSLELAGHPRPGKSACALHRCDNPACVNPDHLWWGTRKENTRDMMAKGRNDFSGLEEGRKPGNPLPAVNCHNCGTRFTTSKYRFQVNIRHFCTAECSRRWQSENFAGTPRDQFQSCGAPFTGEPQ